MGFLDHSTNNIVVDAVLTTKGRELLANNDDSFSVSFFALGDDEVDYKIISEFGRTVGREKIEKNTPIMEALTVGANSLKYKLFNYQSTTLGGSIYFPTGEFSGVNLTSGILKLYTLENITKDFTYTLSMKDNASIPIGLRNGGFEIEVDNNVLVLSNSSTGRAAGGGAEFIYADGTAAYEVRGTSPSGDQSKYGTTVGIRINDSAVNATSFNLYKVKNQTYIRTYLTIRHKVSGRTDRLEVQVYQGTSSTAS